MQDLLEPNFLPPLPNIAQDGRRNQFSHLLLHFFLEKGNLLPPLQQHTTKFLHSSQH
jgi:hypothetical protein